MLEKTADANTCSIITFKVDFPVQVNYFRHFRQNCTGRHGKQLTSEI